MPIGFCPRLATERTQLTSDGSFPQVLGSLKEKRPRRCVLFAIALWPEHVGLQAARRVSEVLGFHVRISYTRVAAWIPCSLPPIRLAHFGFRLFYIQAYGYHPSLSGESLTQNVFVERLLCRANIRLLFFESRRACCVWAFSCPLTYGFVYALIDSLIHVTMSKPWYTSCLSSPHAYAGEFRRYFYRSCVDLARAFVNLCRYHVAGKRGLAARFTIDVLSACL